MKHLTDILNNSSFTEIIGKKDIVIDEITFDSRNITNNCMFIAVKGTRSDGHNYIDDTIKNVEAAREAGMLAHHLVWPQTLPDLDL